ncbi:MAG: RNA polymerase sigma factor [Planctomycetota bacterium]|jgi:RNA polymerase sigma-70 factor (ECF subfamily)
MEDKLLVLRCKRGSRAALRRIYDKYRDDLLILAIALLKDTSGAEDVLHDVFVSFVQRLEKFKLTGSLKAYLATCVANRARNWNKAKQAQTVELDSAKLLSSDSDGPPEAIVCNEELKRLSEAIAWIGLEQREVITLHIHAGLRFRAIADLQEVSVNTVKSRYRYGIDKLRVILSSEVKE